MSTRRPKHCAQSTPALRRNAVAKAASEVVRIANARGGLTQRIASLIEQARALPPETETTSVLGTGPAGRAVDRSRRFSTSEASEPRDADPAHVWDDFMAARRDLMAEIVTGDGRQPAVR